MKKKILVVDDEAGLRKSIAMRLRMSGGFDVFEAEDGLEGLDLATEHQPDLIITDVYMDRMNGFMMVEQLQEQPETASIPVIMMTANAQQAGAWKSGAAVEYIDKGFAIQDLMKIVNRILKIEQK
jgi:CheY-like chemotaxis protein